jgi:hypothetical protein
VIPLLMKVFVSWYVLFLLIVVSMITELLLNQRFLSFMFWFRLILSLTALIASFFILARFHALHNKQVSKVQKVQHTLHEELKRKDMQIKKLKEERQIFLDTAVKQASRAVDLHYNTVKNQKVKKEKQKSGS